MLKIGGLDMSDLRSDMSSLYRICPVGGRICSDKLNLVLQKSRLGVKTMNVGPDKFNTHKQDYIEHIKIKRTTRSNTNCRNHI
jgi:hypothetical protein